MPEVERKTFVCGHPRAVVLGAGGASRAIVFALQQRGIEDIRIVNRTVERACDAPNG
jgi:shikimate 5-dehydrogenase